MSAASPTQATTNAGVGIRLHNPGSPASGSFPRWGVLLFMVGQLVLGACSTAEQQEQLVRDGGVTYLNTAPGVGYTGSARCQACHAEIYQRYMHSPTGRSMYVLDTTNVIEIFPQDYAVYDSVRDFYYEMVQDSGRFYQREYRLDEEGRIIHERQMEAQFVMGSGTNLRMYFYDEHGMFYQLPLTWYENDVRWNLSPGYREFGNVRFSRYASARCLFCHSSYQREAPDAVERYQPPYELGIGCERCHGPGELHVNQAQRHGREPSETERTIVNPAKLSWQRQLDVCRQCHLQGKSRALRGEQGWFDFRPGQLLAQHHSEYFADRIHVEAFKVANTAFRLEQSRCFKQSGQKMTCTTCHDPHGLPEDTDLNAYHNRNCQQCHPPERLAETDVHYIHAPTDNCVPCHMNQAASDNTLHGVVDTDHWIRIDANLVDIDWSVYRDDPRTHPLIRLVPYLDAQDGRQAARLGIAYLTYFKESDDRTAYLDSALTYLSLSLEKAHDDVAAHLHLGEVLLLKRRPAAAVDTLQHGLDLAPEHSELHFKLGESYRLLDSLSRAIEHYRRAVALKPREPRYLEALGKALAGAGQAQEAVAILERSLAIDAQNPYTYYTLGNLHAMQLNEPEHALAYYRQLVVLDPDFPNAYLNLGNAYALQGNYVEAIAAYEHDLRLHPNSARSHLNLGRVLALAGQPERARQELRRALELDPYIKGARAYLSQLPK